MLSATVWPVLRFPQRIARLLALQAMLAPPLLLIVPPSDMPSMLRTDQGLFSAAHGLPGAAKGFAGEPTAGGPSGSPGGPSDRAEQQYAPPTIANVTSASRKRGAKHAKNRGANAKGKAKRNGRDLVADTKETEH